MNIIERFTRDGVSRFLWGGLTIAFAGLLVWSATEQKSALPSRVHDAQAKAELYTKTVGRSWNGRHAADELRDMMVSESRTPSASIRYSASLSIA